MSIAELQPAPDAQSVSRALLREEIANLVDAAMKDGKIIHTHEHAARLLATHPEVNWSVGHTIDEIVVAATAAGVAVEIARPGPETA